MTFEITEEKYMPDSILSWRKCYDTEDNDVYTYNVGEKSIVNGWTMWLRSHLTKLKIQCPLHLKYKGFTFVFSIKNFTSFDHPFEFVSLDSVDCLKLNCL